MKNIQLLSQKLNHGSRFVLKVPAVSFKFAKLPDETESDDGREEIE